MTAWALLVPFVAAAAPVQTHAPWPEPQVEEVRVDVGGRSVRALCTSSAPRIVFLQDAGGGAADWLAVMERLGDGVPACAYDRSALWPRHTGPGGAAPPHARGWLELAEDLLAVHVALGVRPGAILVGEGVGAMYARLLASTRPGAVGGLVLLEPTHEDLPRLLLPAMSADDWRRWMARRATPNADGVRETELDARARRERRLRLPVTVVTATSRMVAPEWDERFVDEAARQVHESLVRGRPFGRHVPAPDAGPELSRDAPALVADEVRRVWRIVGGG